MTFLFHFHHHLRGSPVRRVAFRAIQVALVYHRRGPPPQEQKLQADGGPQVHGHRAQGPAHRHPAPEQRRRALLAASLPRAAPVPLECRVHGRIRQSGVGGAGGQAAGHPQADDAQAAEGGRGKESGA